MTYFHDRFNKNANDDFIVSSDTDLLDEEILRNLINKHKTEQLPRLEVLEDYYLNRNTEILTGQRRKDDNKADYRAVHNFARYITRFIVGYLTGNPITITHEDEQTNNAIMEVNDFNDADAVNSDLALNLSIYGRAYEIVYRNMNDEDTFKVLDPKSTFAVYDDTLDKNIIAGIRYYSTRTKDNTPVDNIEIYTSTDIHYIKMESGKFSEFNQVPHFRKEVPIIEYVNDQFKQGDFENVLTLIDLYDSAESDTANYMTDLNDAMLAIIGNMVLDDSAVKGFNDANMIQIAPEINADGVEGKADVKYIYKQYDVAGVEAYKKRLQSDIHKFTNTPDMTDENFSGVQSGEAMKYKMFGLEQVRAVKERLFKKGLMQRYKLLFTTINLIGTKQHDYKALKITFTPNIPKAMKEDVEVFNMLNGGISEHTRLSLLSFIDNPNEELEQMKKEKDEAMKEDDNRGLNDVFGQQQQDDTKQEKPKDEAVDVNE